MDAETLTSHFRFLPTVLEILETIEGGDERQTAKCVEKLTSQFKKCLELLNSLPSVDVSHEEQVRQYKQLEIMLEKKRQILKIISKADDSMQVDPAPTNGVSPFQGSS